jgi:phage terminase small subunit
VVRCRQELAEAPLTSFNEKSGAHRAHPLLSVLSGAERSLVSFASELGMSPTARARAAVVEPAGGDDLDAFLAAAPGA